MSDDIRKALRAATIGGKKEFKRTQVEYNGQKFEMKQPTLRQRKDIISKCIDKDTGNVDAISLQVESVIALTVIPGTDEKVFEDADRESMFNYPSGSFIDVFSEKAVEILTGDMGNGQPKD